MERLLLNPSSRSELKLLKEIAEKMGITGRVISEKEMEDIGLLKAMNEAKNDPFVSEAKVMKILQKK